MNIDTTLMCVDCGRQRCSCCTFENHGPKNYTESSDTQEEVEKDRSTGPWAFNVSGLAQQRFQELDGDISSAPAGIGSQPKTAPHLTAGDQLPGIQGLSLVSPASFQQPGTELKTRTEGHAEFPETVSPALLAKDFLPGLEDDSDEEDTGSSRVFTPATTSSDEIAATTRLSGLPDPDDLEEASTQANTPQSDWEAVISAEASVIDRQHLVELFSQAFESVFQDWLRHGAHQAGTRGGPTHGEHSSSSSRSWSGLAGKDAPESKDLKRKRSERPGEEDNDGRRKSRSSGKLPQGKPHPLQQMLACHFCKRDPRRYRKCCNFGGAKISYVKQHIYRKHSVNIYCPRCMQQFDSAYTRDQHTRLGQCQLRDILERPEGITSEQRDWMSRRMPSGTSEEQRWYAVWDHLFPDATRPPSPYNNFDLSEDLFEFSDFITSPRGYDILLQNLRGNSAWAEEYESLFGPDLSSALGQLFTLWAATRDTRGDGLGADRDRELAVIGHGYSEVSGDSHPTCTEADASSDIPVAGVEGPEFENPELGAVPPQNLGEMGLASVRPANTAEVHASDIVQEDRVELNVTPTSGPTALNYGMGYGMEPIASLGAVLTRAQESRTEDWRLDLIEREELERKEDETAQPPLQLTEYGIDQAGPSGQSLGAYTRGFDFLDFETSTDIPAEDPLIDWENLNLDSLDHEGWDGGYWNVE